MRGVLATIKEIDSSIAADVSVCGIPFARKMLELQRRLDQLCRLIVLLRFEGGSAIIKPLNWVTLCDRLPVFTLRCGGGSGLYSLEK